MSLEDLTGADKGLAQLVPANPTGLDQRSEGDDHIRGVKNALLNTFGVMQARTASLPGQDYLLAWDTVALRYRPIAPGAIAFPLPPGTLVGLALANNAVDVINDIDIAAGKCRGQGDTGNIAGAAMTKRLDAAWTLGNAGGFRAAGVALADQTYHVFAGRRPDTGVVDYFADTSVTGVNVPATDAAYTERRRIGSIIRVAGAIKPFQQIGDYFQWVNPAADDILGGWLAAGKTFAYPNSIPLGVVVEVFWKVNVQFDGNNTPGFVRIYTPGLTDIGVNSAPNAIADFGHLFNAPPSGAHRASYSGRTWSNAAQQLRAAGDNASIVNHRIFGYTDRRGRDDA